MEWNLVLEKEYVKMKVCDNNDEKCPIYIQQETPNGEFTDIELTQEEAEDLVGAIFSILNLDKYKEE